MNGRPVVPEGHRAGPPGEPDLVLGLAVLIDDERQQLDAVIAIQPDDGGVLGEIHPQDLLAGLTVDTDDRVGHDGIVAAGADQGRTEIVGHEEALESLLDVVGQRLVGQVGVHPDGVPAGLWQRHRPEDCTPGGDESPTRVGVIGIPTRLVSEVRIFRSLLEVLRSDLVNRRDVVGLLRARVPVQGPEAGGEGFVLLPVEVLVPEKDDFVLKQGLLQYGPGGSRSSGFAQVEALDLRPDGRLERVDDDVHVRRDCSLGCDTHREPPG